MAAPSFSSVLGGRSGLAASEAYTAALRKAPVEVLNSRDLFLIYNNQAEIEEINPDFDKIMALEDVFAIIVTAPGDNCDFVSRFFAPKGGIPEDPVTGSAHCSLIPYWSERLNKQKLHARQLSKRGGGLVLAARVAADPRGANLL